MSEVILHMGLHKTATSALQGQFFPTCADLHLLTTIVPEMRRFRDLVTRKDVLYFDPEETRQIILPVLSEEKPNLLSNESFSGPPYAGLIEYGLDHRSPVLANLQAVFPEARAILVLRRQDALSRSLYRQYLKVGGTRHVCRFYGLQGGSNPPMMTLDRFYFARYVDAVTAAFPRGVLVLAFEEFVQDQRSFLHKLVEFIGVECPEIRLEAENATTLGPMGMEVSRILNHLFRSGLNPGGLLPGVPMWNNRPVWTNRRLQFVSPLSILHDKWPGKRGQLRRGAIFEVGREILDRVREDNKDLDRKHQLGLDQFGYY